MNEHCNDLAFLGVYWTGDSHKIIYFGAGYIHQGILARKSVQFVIVKFIIPVDVL